jgi:hypothetical protein
MSKSAESNNVERFRTMELKKLKKSNRTNWDKCPEKAEKDVSE